MNDLVLRKLAEKWKREAASAVIQVAPMMDAQDGRRQGREEGRLDALNKCADDIERLLELLGDDA